jgi:Hen1-like subunit of RNA repair complex
MLLTITTTHRPAHDLGYLLHKPPERFLSFDLSFGQAHDYYPEVSAEPCKAWLLLEVDWVGTSMVEVSRLIFPEILVEIEADAVVPS